MAANVGAALPLLGVAFWLIPRYGLTGAAITSLLYAAAINTAKTVFVARALHLHAFSPPLLRPLGAAAGAGALAAVAEHAGGIGVTLPGTLALAAIVIAVYVAALALLGGMSREDRSALALAVRGR
jgi:O-antigen/teichoic acid export membrane protein